MANLIIDFHTNHTIMQDLFSPQKSQLKLLYTFSHIENNLSNHDTVTRNPNLTLLYAFSKSNFKSCQHVF
jgi:hypothetical protein